MNRNITAILITACALALPAAAHAQSSQADKPKQDTSASPQSTKDKETPGFMDDAMITTRIKVEYAKDDLVKATRISVNTDKGVVRLSGIASSQAEAEKAESIAKSTQGVVSVQNEIRIEPKQESK